MRPTIPALVLAAVTALAAPLATAPAASAKAGPTSVTLEGRGNGHGHGMSQWGAAYMASHGKSYRQILGFYYPGTKWGTTSGTISVLITGDTTSDVVVADRSGLRATSLGNGRTWSLRNKAAKRWRLTPANGGADTRLSVLTGSWHSVRILRGQAQLSAGGAPLRLFVPGGSRSYRGALRSVGGAQRDTVNVVSLEGYLRGVVPQEAYPSWNAAALRAQAVAARTYAAFERDDTHHAGFQVYDDTRDQAYGGASAEVASTDRAVADTARQVLTYGGKPAYTQFSASNGGWTADGGRPYLPAQQDPYDHWAGNPWNGVSCRTSISAKAIEKALPAIGTFQSASVPAVGGRDGHGLWGGRVLKIRVRGSSATSTLTGDQFRSYFGLCSTWFRIV
jgi:SpoIID/LytB domain protein